MRGTMIGQKTKTQNAVDALRRSKTKVRNQFSPKVYETPRSVATSISAARDTRIFFFEMSIGNIPTFFEMCQEVARLCTINSPCGRGENKPAGEFDFTKN